MGDAVINILNAIRFAIAMRPIVKRVIDDLYRLTGGDVQLATAVILRIRDDGYKLVEARADVDARLAAVERRERGEP